ncbi:Hypothetical predicted protein, partial [Olea europaea subsp. europaea]
IGDKAKLSITSKLSRIVFLNHSEPNPKGTVPNCMSATLPNLSKFFLTDSATTWILLWTFKIPPPPENVYPFASRVLNEIRFFFKFRTCRTWPRYLTVPSFNLNLTLPILATLQ